MSNDKVYPSSGALANSGISLRDKIALEAMKCYIATGGFAYDQKGLAIEAYTTADYMLQAKNM